MFEKEKYKQLINLLPLIIMCAVAPLIVYAKAVPLGGVVAKVWGKDLDVDAFSWYKALVIVLCGAAMLIMLFLQSRSQTNDLPFCKICNGLSNEKKNHQNQFIYFLYFAPLLVYFVFTFLSAVFSDYKALAFIGFPERYEGMLVIAGYIITIFYIMNTVRDERSIKAIILPLIISAVLLSIPGIFQYFKVDYFQSDIIRSILFGPEIKKAPKVLYDWDAVYSTLYNPNYVGSYMAMLLPISVTFYILSENKEHKLMLFAVCSILFACQIGSRSRAGFLGLLFTSLVLLFLLRKKLIKNFVYIIGLALAFGLIFTGMNSIKADDLKNQYERIGTELKAVVTTSEVATPINNIIVDKTRISVDTASNPIDIVYDNNEFRFTDTHGKTLETQQKVSEEGINILFKDEKYNDYKFVFDTTQKTLNMTKSNSKFMFALSDNELTFLDNKGRPAKIKPVEKLDLGGREYVVKGRIYIWTRTIPILLDSLFIGKGPDTFPIYFPQDDYIGKLNGIGDMWIPIDKPHNLYLQVGVSGGIVSMLAFIVLFAVYFFHSLYLYFNIKRFDFTSSSGIAFFAAFCGYAVAAVFNDSVVSVAPVFWVLLGLGIAVNLKLNESFKITRTVEN